MRNSRFVTALAVLVTCFSCNSVETSRAGYDGALPVYEGTDLGMSYSPEQTFFRMWSPGADSVRLRIYRTGHLDDLAESVLMSRGEGGTWTYQLSGDHDGSYYTYQVCQDGEWLQEKPDLYAVSTGVNGQRAMILDLDETDPPGWSADERPPLQKPSDIIIYEAHIRDLTIDPSSGVRQKGKFTGLVEEGTQTPSGYATGIDHLKQLGITHIHLLPSFDHRSIDETRLDSAQYNWGYDPVNYNVPEGSFSTDPYDGSVRVREFKEMVQGFHRNGIRVVMDVVYNHTSQSAESNFSQLVPGYFYRFREDGSFSDASACGNETASEKAMMRKFMIESVKYWVQEYHIDGFRFDLMGIHDIGTMNELAAELKAIDPTIFIYGEGWTAGESPLPPEDQALKMNMREMPGVAAFSDDIRDGLKGSVFDHHDRGFASGKPGMKESIKFGLVGSVFHPQVNYDSVNYSKEPWADHPSQSINYVSCHDNHTLFDKLRISMPGASTEEIAAMHRLANTIVLTSQGIPFLHAGVEFMRSKQGVENSYNSPDSINRIDWNQKQEFEEHTAYYQSLIAMRKNHPAFRLGRGDLVREAVAFHETGDDLLLLCEIDGTRAGDNWKKILVAANGDLSEKNFSLPEGEWVQVSNGQIIDENGLVRHSGGSQLSLPASAAFIFCQY